MAINLNSSELVNIVIEITARKSKILLTENDILELYKKHDYLESLCEYIGKDNFPVRIYPDEYDLLVLQLRKAVGNIQSIKSQSDVLVSEIKQMLSEGINV